MTATKENYQVTVSDLNGVVLRLNSILARVSDRLDKMEGIRGELETASGTFTDDISTDGNVSVDGSIFVYDSDGNTIHSME